MKQLIILILLSCATFAWGQGKQVTFKKKDKSALISGDTLHHRAVYITLSPFNQNIVYERNIGNGRRNYHFLKFGYGLTQGLFGDQNQTVNLSIGFLTGKNKNNHLEAYAGGAIVYRWDDYRYNQGYQSNNFGNYIDPYPTFFLGYRHQKPQRPFVFRFGFGYPELLAISAGIAF